MTTYLGDAHIRLFQLIAQEFDLLLKSTNFVIVLKDSVGGGAQHAHVALFQVCLAVQIAHQSRGRHFFSGAALLKKKTR